MKRVNKRVVGSTDLARAETREGGNTEVVAKHLGMAPEFEGNLSTRLGLELENFVRDEWAREYALENPGAEIKFIDDMRQGIYQHPNAEFSTTTIDEAVAIDGKLHLVELTTTRAAGAKYWEHGPSDYKLIQAQDQLEVLGQDVEGVFVCCLTFEPRLRWYKLGRNERIGIHGLSVKQRLWDHICMKELPEPENASLELLRQVYPTSNEEIITLPEPDMELVESFLEYDRYVKDYGKLRDKAKASLIAKIGGNAGGKLNGYAVNHKAHSVTRLNSKLVKQKYPAVFDECSETTKQRRFAIKETR